MNFTRIGGRKFLMTMGAGITGTTLLVFGHINQDHFVELVKWTVSAYILGGTVENVPGILDKLKAPPK